VDNMPKPVPAERADAIARAIEVFVRAFSYTRSTTHPYVAERIGPVWVMRDAERRRGDYRNEEWVAHGVDAAELDQIAREHTRGRFAICAICGADEPQDALRADFKRLGYRLGRTEALMSHGLLAIPSFESPAAIERVTTQELAERLARATGSRPTRPEHFAADSPLRQHVALIDGEAVGWVSSITVDDATWCENMHVLPEFRRRGIARAMLSRMLTDDCALGARRAVLLASHAGARLYPTVGYEQIGTLLLYTPRR
jgi:GNAT superfamily N-acetyltransferase